MAFTQGQSNAGIETPNEQKPSKLNETAELVRSSLAKSVYSPDSLLYKPNEKLEGMTLLQACNAFERDEKPEMSAALSGEIQKLIEKDGLSPQEKTVLVNFANKWARRISAS